MNILLSGDGGQGIQLLSDLLCRACFNKDWQISHIPNYGLEQRGGVSLAYIKISDKAIVYPKFSTPDILMILSEQARERTKDYQLEGVNILDVKDYLEKLKDVPAQSYNIFFLGLLSKMLEEKNIVSSKDIFSLLEAKLSSKPGWEENKKAFQLTS